MKQTENEELKIIKMMVTKESHIFIESLKKELRVRGNKEFQAGTILDAAILKLGEPFRESLLQKHTPFDYRLKFALEDEKKRKQIEKIIGGV